MEDLTGGVTTMIKTNRILSKERLWKELEQVRFKINYMSN